MTLDDLANISEIVGAVAVVVTLIYLSLQVRQNTRAVRTDAYHQATQQLWETGNVIAQDPELTKIVYIGSSALGKVTDEDRFRFQYIVSSFLFGTEFLLRLYESGQIERDDWENVFDNNLVWLAQPGIRELMQTRPGQVSKRLLQLVDKAAAQTPLI